MSLTITEIKRYDKDKNGSPLVNRNGKPYQRVVIKVGGNENQISGFGSELTDSWNVGDEVDVEITQSGKYWNFKPATQKSMEANLVIAKLDEILSLLRGKQSQEHIPDEKVDW